MNDLANTTAHNCQSCERPDTAEDEMVQCHLCQLWEHFGCAGVDERVKASSIQFACKNCSDKQKASTSAANKKHLKSMTSSVKGSKAGSRRSKQLPNIPGSATSSSRALLEEQLKMIDEERRLQEQELEEQTELKRREMEESERQLQEKKKIAEEEKRLREQQLKEESAMKALQQKIRRESLEKRCSD